MTTDANRTSDAVSKRLNEYRFRADNAARRGSKFVVDLTPDELIALVECAEALRVFADMDRPNCDLDEPACTRGIASDMTILISRDFRRASEVLAKLEAL